MSRVAVVTGGASGIGLGVAHALVADGHRVALLDRNGAAAEAAAGARSAARGVGVEVDVADRASVDSAFEQVRRELGPIGIVVTSAGIESFDRLLDITAETWDRMHRGQPHRHIRLHPGRGARHARRQVGPHRHDRVAERPVRCAEHGPLRGVEGRRHLAHQGACRRAGPQRDHGQLDLAQPRRHPDGTRRRSGRRLPRRRRRRSDDPARPSGTPADIAAACAFLCSEGGGYITGQVIGVNGGMYI